MLTRELLLTCTSLLALTSLAPRPADQAELQEPAPSVEVASQLLFFSILEGLYEDGVSNEVVDALTEIGEEEQWPRHFIWACPICMPCYDAFHAYRSRPGFAGRKIPRDAFGDGLPDEVRASILDGDAAARAEALQRLVQDWVQRRLARLELSEAERVAIADMLKAMQEKGLAYLDSYRKSEPTRSHYAHLKTCPLCAGATQGSVMGF